MTRASSSLPLWAARSAVAATFFLTFAAPAQAWGQEEAAPDPAAAEAAPADSAETAPADAAPDAGAPATDAVAAPAPTDAPVAPAEGQAGTVPTVPVQTGEAAEPLPKGATEFDTLEVTGSRLKRSDYETAQPVVVLSREDIERTGQTDVNEILRRLNVAGNNTIQPAFGRSFTSMGEANLDLRNLGGQHTLLLVNGRRWVTGLVSTQPNISDLNTIPTSIIERIEVLKDGASAIYGSDAIAGVVNIITRKDYEGYGVDYQIGQYIAEGDGTNQQFSFDWGLTRQGTNAFVNVSYTRLDLAEAENHEFTSSPMPTAGFTRWGNATPRGRYVFVPDQANSDYYSSGVNGSMPCPNINAALLGLAPVPSNSTMQGINQQTQPLPAGLQLCDLHTLVNADFSGPPNRANYRQQVKTGGEDLYNSFLDGTLVAPMKRTAVFGQFTHDLNEHVNLTVDGLYNLRDSTTVSYSATLLGGNAFLAPSAFVGADHPENPFQQNIGNSQAVEQGYGAWLIRTQTANTFGQKARTIRLGATLRGDVEVFGHAINWDFGHIDSTNKIEEISPLQRVDLTGIALGSSMDPDTGAPLPYDIGPCNDTPGCVPLNVFQGISGIAPGALDFLFSNVWQRNRNSQNITFLDFAGEIPQPVSWLAGPIAAATGLEVRRDKYESSVDPLLREEYGTYVQLNQLQDSGGEAEAREAYVEFSIPVVKDLFLADVVDLDLAGRYSEYPGFGSVTTYKTGLRWQPIEDLLVRGTYSTGFRAPSIAELYLPSSQSFEPLFDPCISGDPNHPQSATTQANCQEDNVVGVSSVTSNPYNAWQGNRDLQPEESINITYGLIYSPSYVPDLNIAVDFYDVVVDKFILIGPPLGQNFLNSCYTTVERTNCDKIHRDETSAGPVVQRGDVLYVDVPFTNLGKIETRGVDFDADYLLPLPDVIGQFKIRLDASYLIQFDRVIPGNDPEVDGRVGKADGLYTSYPRWKALTELTWKQDVWTASWTSRLAYHLTEPCGDLIAPSYRELGLCSNPVPPVFDDPGTPNVDETQPDRSENHLKSVIYHNLQVGRDLPQWNADITLGVHNVLDQDPPYSYSLIGSRLWFNYDPTAYETPGRFGYVRVGFKF